MVTIGPVYWGTTQKALFSFLFGFYEINIGMADIGSWLLEKQILGQTMLGNHDQENHN